MRSHDLKRQVGAARRQGGVPVDRERLRNPSIGAVPRAHPRVPNLSWDTESFSHVFPAPARAHSDDKVPSSELDFR